MPPLLSDGVNHLDFEMQLPTALVVRKALVQANCEHFDYSKTAEGLSNDEDKRSKKSY